MMTMCTTCQSAGWWKHLSYWFVSWSFSTANCVFHLFIYSLCKSKMFSGVIERQQNADAVQHFSWLWLDCQYGITWNIKYSLLVGRSGLLGFSRNDTPFHLLELCITSQTGRSIGVMWPPLPSQQSPAWGVTVKTSRQLLPIGNF